MWLTLNPISLVYSFFIKFPLFRVAFYEFYVSAKILIFDPSLSYLFLPLKKPIRGSFQIVAVLYFLLVIPFSAIKDMFPGHLGGSVG